MRGTQRSQQHYLQQPKYPSTDEWIKLWCTEQYNGILFSHKKTKSATCNNTNGPGGYYASCNKSDRERHILYAITYISNLKNRANECNKTEIDLQIYVTNQWLTGSTGREGETGREKEKERKRYKTEVGD